MDARGGNGQSHAEGVAASATGNNSQALEQPVKEFKIYLGGTYSKRVTKAEHEALTSVDPIGGC